jgi:hypothetical protein
MMGKASRKKLLQKQTKQPSEVKLSEALLNLSKPFNPNADMSRNQLQNLITMAATAWNIALFPENERFKQLKTFVEATTHIEEDSGVKQAKRIENDKQEQVDVTLYLVAKMIERKDELYPNDNRLILDFTMEDTPRGYHIQVASIIKPTEQSAPVQVEM